MILPSNLVHFNAIAKLWTFEGERSKWQKRQCHTLEALSLSPYVYGYSPSRNWHSGDKHAALMRVRVFNARCVCYILFLFSCLSRSQRFLCRILICNSKNLCM